MAANMAELTDEALVHTVLQLERELVGARFKHSMNQLENTATLRVIRRNIARLRTEARRREQDAGLGKDSLVHRYRTTFQAGEVVEGADAEKGGLLSGIVDKLTGSE